MLIAARIMDFRKSRQYELKLLREFAIVALVLYAVMGALGHLSGETPHYSVVSLSPAAVGHVTELSRADALLAGTDPVADPSLFDRYDAELALDGVVGHLPSGPSGGMFAAAAPSKKAPGNTRIVINKAAHTLTLFKDGKEVAEYGIAVGKNKGDKQKVGDCRTPEGDFEVCQIQNASSWVHDFKDGKGPIAGAYGPYFIRLLTTPWKGIGIHGTHDPASIGTDATEGCIRMHNDELLELMKYVGIGTKVKIMADNGR